MRGDSHVRARRDTVVVRAERRSTHSRWLTGPVHDFDLFVVAHEPLPDHRVEASTHHLVAGTKVAGWSRYIREQAWILDAYEAVAKSALPFFETRIDRL